MTWNVECLPRRLPITRCASVIGTTGRNRYESEKRNLTSGTPFFPNPLNKNLVYKPHNRDGYRPYVTLVTIRSYRQQRQ